MRMSSDTTQSRTGKLQLVIALLPLFQQNRMNICPFQVVDRNQRMSSAKASRLGIADAHQQRSGKTRALR